MSDAWRMPPPFYDSPSKESVLLGLMSMDYVEGSTTSNVLILLVMGVVLRLLAFGALCHVNRDKMGLRPLSDLVAVPLLAAASAVLRVLVVLPISCCVRAVSALLSRCARCRCTSDRRASCTRR